ncbi:MAG: hypothetical protein KKF67_03655 [Nanoarchaeota archaeon]|nr:hypothetical protein [Nanoarchaeota archaeon]
MQREFWVGYTGDEPDEILLNYVKDGDWVQLRKGFRHNGLSRRRIYCIKEVFRSGTNNSQLKGLLTDNYGKERKVLLNRFKYITTNQRASVVARVLNESFSPNL